MLAMSFNHKGVYRTAPGLLKSCHVLSQHKLIFNLIFEMSTNKVEGLGISWALFKTIFNS